MCSGFRPEVSWIGLSPTTQITQTTKRCVRVSSKLVAIPPSIEQLLNFKSNVNKHLDNVVGGGVDSALRHRLGDKEEVIPGGKLMSDFRRRVIGEFTSLVE